MMSFYLSGGVEVLGFISPTEPTDEYPVIDPLYGIDGFRNVNTLSDLNSIPNLRRRAGMVVGVSGGTQYYKLNPSPWTGTITDWDTFSLGGGTFTGGTVTGDTIFTQGLTATTFSAATYLGLPLDVYVTGGTYSNGTIIFKNNSGGTFNVIGLSTGTTINLSGGTGISVSGTSPNFIVENTLPDQVVSISGGTNIKVSGAYPNFDIEFTGVTSSPFTGGTVTGDTIFTQGLTATTFSASTYLGLPLDVYTTGFTFNPSTYDISIERNDGVTLTQNLSILATDVTITGGTYDPLNGSITFVNNTGGTFTVSGFITGFTDIQVTGYTYQDNTFTISDSSGNTFSVTIDVMTGLTVNGLLSATTLNVNGILITGDTYTTGGTYSNGTLDFYNNTGGSYQVTGLYTGQTSYVNSLTTGVGLSGDSTTGNITIINTDPDQIVSISGGTGILTGGTYPNFTIENSLPDQTVVLNNGTNISVTGTYPNFTIDVTGLTDNNTYTTGFTYQDNTFTISDSSGNTFNATINSVTGLTVNGILSATTISGGTLYGDGSNLTGLSTGLNVGTTQITNGTDTRVLFQSGTTLQQDGNFTFDPTLKRLTLKAVGTAVTDIPFVVRNSTDTFDILACYGNETTIIGRNASNEPRLLINRAGSTKMTLGGTTDLNIQFPNSGFGQLNSGTQGWDIISSTGDIRTRNSSTSTILKGNFFGVGIANPAARLDVLAQGALSTDIAFRVRNSADSQNIISVLGNGNTVFNSQTLGSTYLTIGQSGAGNSADGFLDFASSRGIRSRYGGVVQTGIRLFYNSTSRNVGFYVSSSEASGDSTIFIDGGQNIRIGQGYSNTNQPDANATRTIQQMTGVAPTTSVADGFQQYSADVVAGNAAPHFRTEAGNIVKLYTHSAVTTTQEIANALTTLGLLSASTISPSTDYYVTGGTYDFTGDTLTLERNDGNQVQITGFTYERQSDYVYPYFYGGSAPLYTLTSTSTWIIKRVDYTTPGSPIIQQAIGSWDNRYTLTYI